MAETRRDVSVYLNIKEGTKAGLGSIADQVRGLSDTLGKKSDIGVLGQFLAGKGPVAGVNRFLGEVTEGFNKFSQLRSELDQGTISAGQMTEKIIEGIPVIGKFAQAGLAIREAFTGEQEEIDTILRHAERMNESSEHTLKTNQRINESYREQGDYLKKISDEMERMDRRGVNLAHMTEKQNSENEQKRIKNEAAKAAQARKETFDKESKAIKEKVAGFGDLDARANEEKTVKYVSGGTGAAPSAYGGAVSDTTQKQLNERATLNTQLAKLTEDYDREDKRAKEKAAEETAARDKLEIKNRAKIEAEYQNNLKESKIAAGEGEAKADADVQQRIADQQTESHQKELRAQAERFDKEGEIAKGAAASLAADLEDIERRRVDANKAAQDKIGEAFEREAKAEREAVAHPSREADDEAIAAGKARHNQLKRSEAEIEANNAAANDAAKEARLKSEEEIHDKSIALADSRAEKDHQITRDKIALLESEAAMGAKGAAFEAQKLKIADEYKSKREEINKILRDESSTDEQKKAAKQALMLNDVHLKAALDGAGRPFASGRIGIQDSRFLTGATESQEQQRQAAYFQKQQEIQKQAQENTTKIETLLQDVTNAAAQFLTQFGVVTAGTT